mmetsp:Transcript_6762/g.10341  ORF Transcript_6762/g.10341 Transcript_6762/m.10341 type:complete len:529 (+) Transcript_6762:379-1965(+)
MFSRTMSSQIERQHTILDSAEGGGYGHKTIGTLGSFVLLVNNITGPGLVVLPLAYQKSGWIVSTFGVIFLGVISAISCDMLIESMARIQGNENFQGRVEFTYLAKKLLSRKSYYCVLVLFLFALITTNISSIVESGQVIDGALLDAGHACALRIYPEPGFICLKRGQGSDSDSVFGNDYVISVGYIVIMVVSIPMGLLNLDDNIFVQVLSFVGLLVVCVVWFVYFCWEGLDSGLAPSYSHSAAALGYLFFNYGYVITIPSWINEKRENVPIRSMVWQTTVLGALMFALVGFLGAMSHKYTHGEDLLSVLTSNSVSLCTRLVTYLFPLFSLVTSIPVFSIIMRYNLLENNICTPAVANFWSVIFPWVISLFFYGGTSVNYILTWAGILTVGPLNFIVPIWLYRQSRTFDDEDESYGYVNKNFESSGRMESKYSKLATVVEDGSISLIEEEKKDCTSITSRQPSAKIILSKSPRLLSAFRRSSIKQPQYEALPGWKNRSIKKLCISIVALVAIINIYTAVAQVIEEVNGS